MQEVGAGLRLLCYPDPGAKVTASFDKETDSEVKNKSAAGATAECCRGCLARGWCSAQSQTRKTLNKTEQQKELGSSITRASH